MFLIPYQRKSFRSELPVSGLKSAVLREVAKTEQGKLDPSSASEQACGDYTVKIDGDRVTLALAYMDANTKSSVRSVVITKPETALTFSEQDGGSGVAITCKPSLPMVLVLAVVTAIALALLIASIVNGAMWGVWAAAAVAVLNYALHLLLFHSRCGKLAAAVERGLS